MIASARITVWLPAVTLIAAACGQEQYPPAQLSEDRYAHASSFLHWQKDRYLNNDAPPFGWIPGADVDLLWYVEENDDGKRFFIADAANGTISPTFDHELMADALSAALEDSVDPQSLPIDALVYEAGENLPRVHVSGQQYRCDLAGQACEVVTTPELAPGELLIGSKTVIYHQDNNILARDLDGSNVRFLTTDGTDDRPYARLPGSSTYDVSLRRAGVELGPSILQSPDQETFLTYRLDQRGVEPLHLLQSVPEDGSFRPRLFSYPFDFVGGPIPMAELFIVNPTTKRSIAVDLPPSPSSLFPPTLSGYVWWDESGGKLYVLWSSNYYTTLHFAEVNAENGKARILLEESSDTVFYPSATLAMPPNLFVLRNGDFIWYSERSGWGHLYRYNAQGQLLNGITSGNWLVRQVIHVDEEQEMIYFTASGREADRNPYFRSLYRVNLDGTQLELLTPEAADHEIRQPAPAYAAIFDQGASSFQSTAFSPSADYFVDVYSTPQQPSRMTLRRSNGTKVMDLTRGSNPAMPSDRYTLPEPFEGIAADGETPLYGVLYKPGDFDPSRSYAIIDSIYPGPQITRTPTRFSDAMFGPRGAQALAELGFIVVAIDGRGTPFRSKAFRDASYGKLQTAGFLEDHVAIIRQLAEDRPYIDIERVGIYGASGGGFATVRALLDYPEFFKVGIASAGNYELRAYISMWGETYHGPLESADYDVVAGTTGIDALAGKLFLVHGEMDDNVHPAHTLRVVDALIKSNKDFDLLIVPNVNHGVGGQPYVIRRSWDYFVRHLMGATPPSNFELQGPEQ